MAGAAAVPPDPPIDVGFDRYASVTIQGGAVYGLSLLGQLQAVLDEGYEVVALAGTSAGAIVATLHWAGLKTSDVRDFFVALAGPPNTVTDLLGNPDPGPTQLNQAAVARRMRWAAWAGGAFSHPEPPSWYGKWLRRGARAVRGLYGLTRLGVAGWSGGGVFPGTVFEREIDRLIRTSPRVARHVKSGRLPADRLLTFGDLWGLLEAGDEFFPALTLTATDLCTRRLVLIDSTDPRFFDVPVARAVRASGGFPWFFRPVEVELPDVDDANVRRVHSLVDGGVVCNFPAYVFARRIRREQFGQSLGGIYQPYAMRPWVNIGLRLTDTTPPAPGPERFRTLGGLTGGMATFLSEGTRTFLETELAESTVERLFSIGQPFDQTGWPYDLLAFDRLTPGLVRTMYDKGREFARGQLTQIEFARPPAEHVEPRMTELVASAAALLGDPDNAALEFRATLFVPEEFDLVLRYRANMDDPADTDTDLRFEFGTGLVGHCFVRRRPVLCNLSDLAADTAAGDKQFGLPPNLRSKVRKDRTWLLSVPVFDPATASPYPFGDDPVVGVEGSHYVELDAPLDAAVFGVLSLDAAIGYDTLGLPTDPAAQAADPRVRGLRDIMLAAAWDLGKVFDAYFAAVPPEFGDGEETDG